MAKRTINYVLDGQYKNKEIYHFSESNFIEIIGGGSIKKEHIISYQVLDENNKNSSKEYLVSIKWKSGDTSLISLDNEYYNIFVVSMS